MTNKIFSRILTWAAAISVVLFSASCQQEHLPDGPGAVPGSADSEYMTLPVSIAQEGVLETKASMLNGAEAAGSGAVILVYRADTKVIDRYYFFSQAQLNNQGTSHLEIEVPRTVCDFYILGNLNLIRKSGGAAVNLADAYGNTAISSESDLESIVYRLDGADVNSTYRRETMSEVKTYGLPYQHIVKGVNVESVSGIPGSNACQRLFSKVSVTIDHSAFDGGSAAHVDYFVNKKLYMRQVNGKMKPFSTESVKASSAGDLVTGDYDDNMAPTNTGYGTYVFYVPENRQGTVSGIGFPKDKTMTNTAIPEAVRSYGTYVEFTGTLSGAVGGFSGDVTYKFFLGENNTTNFNVTRGKDYQVTLSFKSGSLFNPYWKVNADLSDVRLFHLTSDQAYSHDLPDDQMVAVRKNRPGAVYVWSAASPSLPNLLEGKEVVDPSYSPSSAQDCAWTSDFLSATNASADVPNRAWLSDRGITPAWDAAHGKLTFTVTDASKFNAHIGEEKTLTLTLLPGDGSNTVRLKLKLAENISVVVADGKSLTENFYMGQKRHVTVSGFTASDIRYAAVQTACGTQSGSAQNLNRQWKTVNTGGISSGYPTCAVDGSGNPVYDTSESVYSGQVFSGEMDIYAWYPNRFQGSHGWSSQDGKIVLFSADGLNDTVEIPIRILEPRLVTSDQYATVHRLPLDGTPISTAAYGYRTYDGSTTLSESAFDPTLYSTLFAFSGNVSNSLGDYVGYDIASHKIYCKDTYASAYEDLAAKTLSSKGEVQNGGDRLTGRLTISPNATSGLFSGAVYDTRFCFTAPLVTAIDADGSKDWHSKTTTEVTVNYFKTSVNQYEDDESFWINMKYYFTNSDFADVNIAPEGKKTTYTVGSTTYEPVYEVQASTYDTGSGGEMRWVYDESKQAKQASTGEKIPGGLLLPYGVQRIKFTFTNRHSGRAVTVISEKYVDLKYSTAFAYFVGATNQRYAQVFLVPAKNVKYLKRCASTATRAQRTWMTTLFGHRTWSDGVLVKSAYPYVSGSAAAYHDTYSNPSWGTLPLNNFDVSYFYGSSSATKWANAYLSYLDDVVKPSSGAFAPNHYGSFLVRVQSYSSNFGEGFADATRMLMFGKLTPTDKNYSSIDTGGNSTYGAVHGYYINTIESFANLSL